jgi:hypothetical protein
MEAVMDDRSKESGWQAEDTPQGFREQTEMGAGAVKGGAKHVVEDVAHETKARTGAIPDEHMREGWGGEGESYAPTQGPNHRQDGDRKEEKDFWQGKPPAGID